MINDYFANSKNYNDLVAIVDSWRGTKFHHMAMEKGLGADCTTFIGAVFKELRILTNIQYDYYPSNWYINDANYLINNVERHLRLFLKEGLTYKIVVDDLINEPPYRGDLLLINTWRKGVANHAALMLDNDMIVHCRTGVGVEMRPFSRGCFESLLVKAYRIQELE